MKINEHDVVLCTVKKIEGTTVFVEIEGNGEGNIVFSEVAAGRIRNIRAHVTPNKKIVCKVLKLGKNNIQLSLRRVTAGETKEVINNYKKEKTLTSMLRIITKSPETIIEKIKKEYDIPAFIDEAREDPKVIQKFLPESEAEKLSKILEEKKEKEKLVKKKFMIKSKSSTGLKDIKEILNIKNIKISYLGSSKFSISASGKNFKEANAKLNSAIEEIEKKAKEKSAEFKIKEGK